MHPKRALREACRHGWTADVEALLPTGDKEALVVACASGHADIVRLLVSHVPASLRALKVACQNGHAEVVRTLLSPPALVDPSQEWDIALREACKHGHVAVVRELLADSRVHAQVLNNQPLRLAAVMGRLDVVRLLLAHPQVDPSAHGDNALVVSARTERVDVVRVLLTDARVRPQRAIRHVLKAGRGHRWLRCRRSMWFAL